MSIWSDIKKAAKGSKEYQKGKAKRKAKRAKSPLGKAAKQVVKDVKSAVKGSKEYQAGKAKKKAGKTWTKAVKKQKKSGSGETLSSLVKARNAAKASGDKAAYATAQNKINKAYGSKKVHDPGKPKSLPKKKPVTKAPKKVAPKKVAPKKAAPIDESANIHSPVAVKSKASKAKSPKKKPGEFPKIEPYPGKPGEFAEGGKVEANPYGWPSSDSRKR